MRETLFLAKFAGNFAFGEKEGKNAEKRNRITRVVRPFKIKAAPPPTSRAFIITCSVTRETARGCIFECLGKRSGKPVLLRGTRDSMPLNCRFGALIHFLSLSIGAHLLFHSRVHEISPLSLSLCLSNDSGDHCFPGETRRNERASPTFLSLPLS